MLNEEQREWADEDDGELLPCMCTPGMFLKGYPLRLLCVCVCHKEGCFGIISRVSSCVSLLPLREGAAVVRGGQLSGHLICS